MSCIQNQPGHRGVKLQTEKATRFFQVLTPTLVKQSNFSSLSGWKKHDCPPTNWYVANASNPLWQEILRLRQCSKCCGGGCYVGELGQVASPIPSGEPRFE